MGPRQIAAAAVVLGLTVVGFLGARASGERDADRDAAHRAEIAATQIRGRINQSADLVTSLRQFLVGHVSVGVRNEQLADIGARWLTPSGLPAAAWAERVAASGRASYERHAGHGIVARGRTGSGAPAEARASYLPATLVTGVAPFDMPGIDLGRDPGVAAAVARPRTRRAVTATGLATLPDGTTGLFLVQSAELRTGRAREPGFAVLFVPTSWLRAAAGKTAHPLQLTVGGVSSGNLGGAESARSTFAALGQPFRVLVQRGSVQGAAGLLPWVIVAAGIVLAALAARLGVYAARRARAQREVDRIFTVSPDLIAIYGFDGHVRRVNPAFEQVLGYTADELLARPIAELVHSDDRAETESHFRALRSGQRTVAFENRQIRKDGSHRWLEWTATPALEEQLIYAVGRDVTERRTLTREQAALRRVATLVARGVPPTETFAAVAGEVRRLFGTENAAVARFEPDGAATVVAGMADDSPAIGAVFRTGRSARADDGDGGGSAVASPIVVEGRIWGTIVVSTRGDPLPADAEDAAANFTELVATAIANADSRAELAASRARVVAAADDTRRRIERDLHDGAQQRLVHTVISLKLARRSLAHGGADGAELVDEALAQAEAAIAEVRDLGQGILPSALVRGGLRSGIEALVSRLRLPVSLDMTAERLPPAVEATAYFIIAEALTNTVKHAHASSAQVTAAVQGGTLQLEVRDDGVGGAMKDGRSGLVGLQDRTAALSGEMSVDSPKGGGTVVAVTLPTTAPPDDSRGRGAGPA